MTLIKPSQADITAEPGSPPSLPSRMHTRTKVAGDERLVSPRGPGGCPGDGFPRMSGRRPTPLPRDPRKDPKAAAERWCVHVRAYAYACACTILRVHVRVCLCVCSCSSPVLNRSVYAVLASCGVSSLAVDVCFHVCASSPRECLDPFRPMISWADDFIWERVFKGKVVVKKSWVYARDGIHACRGRVFLSPPMSSRYLPRVEAAKSKVRRHTFKPLCPKVKLPPFLLPLSPPPAPFPLISCHPAPLRFGRLFPPPLRQSRAAEQACADLPPVP